ncbi:DUF6678 family protein [Sphingomonas pruni]|uniref:DUF6678 family protein n=1 Tax=Sphingomonas pruni TaxID=40683 RepID=UPI000836299D
MVDLNNELEKARRAVRRDYAGSLMSSTKWRETLTILGAMEPTIRRVAVKFVDANAPQQMQLPWLSTPHDFADSLEVGPFPLLSIEWMEIPSLVRFPRPNNVPAEDYIQDVTAIRAALERLGKKLPLENTPTGLKIMGHIAAYNQPTDN